MLAVWAHHRALLDMDLYDNVSGMSSEVNMDKEKETRVEQDALRARRGATSAGARHRPFPAALPEAKYPPAAPNPAHGCVNHKIGQHNTNIAKTIWGYLARSTDEGGPL